MRFEEWIKIGLNPIPPGLFEGGSAWDRGGGGSARGL